MSVVNPCKTSERNPLLMEYFGNTEQSISVIDWSVELEKNTSEDVQSEINQVFVSVPTNISIDIVVQDRRVKEVHEGTQQFVVGDDNNKYRDCINRFNAIISPNNVTKADSAKRSLLLRPYWKDGIVKNFLCLKPIDIISTNQYSIVLGGPGTGKSTLLRHLSIRLAKQYYSNENLLEDDAYSEFFFKNRYIPVYVQLRRLFNNKAISDDPMRSINKMSLLKFLFDDKWSEFESLLADQRVIIFFDGIDEIFAGKNICQLVQKLVDASKDINQNVKIVFSSRKESYSTWQLDDFTSFELCPMDKACQQLLAKKVLWTYHFNDKEEKYNTLIKQLESCKLDGQIVGNPLFLSLMVVIYAVNGKLPDQKSVMLEQSIRFLIKRWQDKISKESAQNPYELDQLYSTLKETAYSAMDDSSYDASPLIIQKQLILKELDNLISKSALASFIPNENVVATQEMLLKCLLDSVGVIVPSKDSNQFEFSHRQFQEYLVASKLVDMSNYPKLLMEMITKQRGIQHEIYFMVMEILFDRGNYVELWNALQYFVLYSDSRLRDKTDLYAWITWFCCRVISIRDYSLLKTSAEIEFVSGEILQKINDRANALIASTNELSMQMRIECARYLGKIGEKLLEKNEGEGEDFAKSLAPMLGDKRRGVALSDSGLPDIVWCKIPSGAFTMGLTDEEAKEILRDNPGADLGREQPSVELNTKAFEISKYPITIAQYMAFVESCAYENPEFWSWSKVSKKWFEDIGSKKGKFKKTNVVNAPIVDIAWIEAAAFCVWLSRRTNSKIRLPFECEWEYVARLHHRTFSYSDEFDTEKYVSNKLGLSKAAPVGVYLSDFENYPADMNGNIWEWTQTLIPPECETLQDYKKHLAKRNIALPSEAINNDSRMVARGGAFLNSAFHSRNSYRGRDYIWNHISARQGFRVVKELTNE